MMPAGKLGIGVLGAVAQVGLDVGGQSALDRLSHCTVRGGRWTVVSRLFGGVGMKKEVSVARMPREKNAAPGLELDRTRERWRWRGS